MIVSPPISIISLVYCMDELLSCFSVIAMDYFSITGIVGGPLYHPTNGCFAQGYDSLIRDWNSGIGFWLGTSPD